MHGLGATKACFLPTLAALAPKHRVIAVDLPGFGDSAEAHPAAPTTRRSSRARWCRCSTSSSIDRAALVGNSMGGRVALELDARASGRVTRIALLAPSLAWLRKRPWAPLLRMVPPRLGAHPAGAAADRRGDRAAQPSPARRDGWTAASIDEFLRSYLGARGRAAFYAAARNIYLEKPRGEGGFWTRLPALDTPQPLRLGVETTGSSRSPSREHVRKAAAVGPSTSSCAAGAVRSSSARARRTTRSRGSSRRRPEGSSLSLPHMWQGKT